MKPETVRQYIRAAIKESVDVEELTSRVMGNLGDNLGIYEDVYEQLCDMIEPYVTDDDSSLPGSVVGSVKIMLGSWLATRPEKTRPAVEELLTGNGISTELQDNGTYVDATARLMFDAFNEGLIHV